MLDKLDLSTKAQELREMLGEDANSPVDVFSLAYQIEGLTLVFYPLGDNISGMCVRDNEIRLIAINSTMSYGRQRFSLAHELYHLFYDNESGFNVCSKRLRAHLSIYGATLYMGTTMETFISLTYLIITMHVLAR